MNLSLYLLTVLIWGTTWIALKLQLGEVAIAASIAYRFALAAAVLFAVLLLSGRLQKLDKRGQLICLAQGLCLFCINFMCFYTASQWIPSGLVAVIFSTATLWNAINARLFFKQHRSPPMYWPAARWASAAWPCCSGRNWPGKRRVVKPLWVSAWR